MEPPVLLIHGFKDNERKMERLARHLRAAGRTVHAPRIAPSWGQVGLDVLAGQIATFVEANLAPEEKFDLVGFSMGGLVSQYYLQRLGGLERVRRFVSISAPHAGSVLAWLLPNAGCRQMRPGSAFLRDLASDVERLGELELFLSLWTPFDLSIIPATSSLLSVGKCHRVWCLVHQLMVWQPSILRVVEQALSGDVPATAGSLLTAD